MDYNKIATEKAGVLPEGTYPEKLNKFWGTKRILLMQNGTPKETVILTPETKTSSRLLFEGRVKQLVEDGCPDYVARKAANVRSGMKIWRKAQEISDVVKYIKNPTVESPKHFRKVYNSSTDGLNIHELRNAVKLARKI